MKTVPKQPFEFDAQEWLADADLTACTPATRGIWLDLICRMHQTGRSGRISGTREQLALQARCQLPDLVAALEQLKSLRSASVHHNAEQVTIVCRRMPPAVAKCPGLVPANVPDLGAEGRGTSQPDAEYERLRKQAYRARKRQNSAANDSESVPDLSRRMSRTCPESVPDKKGFGVVLPLSLGTLSLEEGEEKDSKRNTYTEEFERFWKVFPALRKQKKGKAYSAWKQSLRVAKAETIIDAAIEYAASPVGQGQFAQGPAPWLNGRGWEDDRTAWQRGDSTVARPVKDYSP